MKFWGQSAQEKKVRTWAIVSLSCGCILLLFRDPLTRDNFIAGFIIEFCGIGLIICSCLCVFGQVIRMADAGCRYYTILAFTVVLIYDLLQPAYLSLFLLLKPDVVSVILLIITAWCVFVLASVYVKKSIMKAQKASNAQQSPQARIQEQVPSRVIMQKILDNTATCEEMSLDVLITQINEPELTTKELLFKYIEYMLHHGLMQGDLTPDHFKRHKLEHEPSKEIIQKILACTAASKEESLEVLVTQINEPALTQKAILFAYLTYMLEQGFIQGDLTEDYFKRTISPGKRITAQQQADLDANAIYDALVAGPKTRTEIAVATGLQPTRIYTLMFTMKGSLLWGHVGRRLRRDGKNGQPRVQFFLKEGALLHNHP